MPNKKPAAAGRTRAPSGYDFSAFRRGALTDLIGPSPVASIAVARPQGTDRPQATARTSSKPRGALTRLASDAVAGVSRALGSSERDAAQRASRFEQLSHDWNPLSAADTVGTQLRLAADGDRDFDSSALTEGAIGTALTFAPELAAPAAKALAKTTAGRKLKGVLTSGGAQPFTLRELDDMATVNAKTGPVSETLRRSTPDVRTADGAVVTPPPKAPRGVLSQPDEATIPVRHYSHTRDLTEADPQFMGKNPRKNMGRDERSQLQRVYLGENRGLPTDYARDKDVGVGPFSYDGAVRASDVVEVGSPLHQQFKAQAEYVSERPELLQAWGLPARANPQRIVETLQQQAGFPVRYFPAEMTPYGGTFHSFRPVDLTRTPEAPLAGQPLKLDVQGPSQGLRDTARQYMSDSRQAYRPDEEYLSVDPARAEAIAKAYEDMPHAPNDPAVREAYDALAKETLDQYGALKRDGYAFDFYPRAADGTIADPYPSPFDALRDLREGKSMKVYPTDEGYGTQGITDEMIAENPMLALVPGETWGGQPVRVNDVFRAVHDAFGHAKDGVGFRASGEENAWNSHRAMYSPKARRAMTTETRGQNSWLNFGPHGAANRNASTADTVFAEQKVGLMPDWTMEPAGVSPMQRMIDALPAPALADPAPAVPALDDLTGAALRQIKRLDDDQQ
jgi:hypothetical protein